MARVVECFKMLTIFLRWLLAVGGKRAARTPAKRTTLGALLMMIACGAVVVMAVTTFIIWALILGSMALLLLAPGAIAFVLLVVPVVAGMAVAATCSWRALRACAHLCAYVAGAVVGALLALRAMLGANTGTRPDACAGRAAASACSSPAPPKPEPSAAAPTLPAPEAEEPAATVAATPTWAAGLSPDQADQDSHASSWTGASSDHAGCAQACSSPEPSAAASKATRNACPDDSGIGAPASPCASTSSPFALLDSGVAAGGGLCSPRGSSSSSSLGRSSSSSSSNSTAALHVPTPQRASEGVEGCGLSSASSGSSAQLSLEAVVAAPPAAAEPAAPAGPAAAAPAEPLLEFVHSPGGAEMVRDSAELVAAGVREQLGAPRFQHLLELDVAALANQEVQPRTGEQEDGTPASPPPKLQAAHEATDKHLASVQGLRCATACLRPRGSVSSALRVVAGEAAHEQDKGLRYFLAAAHTMWLGLLEQDAPRHAGNTATPQESVKQAVSARVALAQLVERVEKRLQEVEPAGIVAA